MQTIEQLKLQGWINAVLADEEWVPVDLQAEYAGASALLVKKSALIHQFAEDGRQLGPVDFLAVGNGRIVGDVLGSRELLYVIREQYVDWCIMALLPSAEMTGDAKVPGAQMPAS